MEIPRFIIVELRASITNLWKYSRVWLCVNVQYVSRQPVRLGGDRRKCKRFVQLLSGLKLMFGCRYTRHKQRTIALWLNQVCIADRLSDLCSTNPPSLPAGQFGLTFDTSSNGEANSAWTLFTAGSIANSSTSTRNELVSMVYARANSNASTSVGSFPTYYNDTTGASPTPGGGQAR